MISALLTLALQVTPGAVDAQPDTVGLLSPEAVIEAPGIGTVLLTGSPSPGLTGIRLFVPVAERFGEAGAGRVLTELATERVRGLAARTGARFRATRTAAGIAYTVSGSDLDLDHLFAVIARAASVPVDEGVALRRAVSTVATELERASETGQGWVQATLADRMCPTTPPWTGEPADLQALGGPSLRALWARTHRAGPVVVSVASSLPRAVVFAGLDLLVEVLAATDPDPGSSGARGSTPARPPPPSLLRRWYGEARTIPAGYEAEAAVVAELLRGALATESTDFALFAQLRDTACGPILLTVGSAFRGGERSMRQNVTRFVEDFEAGIDAAEAAGAAASLRLQLMMESDTPTGRAAAVASRYEGRPPTAELIASLEGLRLDDVLGFLRVFSASAPMRAEVSP